MSDIEVAKTYSLSPQETALLCGDLSKLSEAQRAELVMKVCDSIGLNPLTRPFQYIELNRKLVLYATKDCTEQLRKLHSVSLTIVSRENIGDAYVVTARASMPGGRCDESTGAVATKGLGGDNLANAMMKTETKAKRRVTLSICGLGLLDESEIDTIPGARVLPPVSLPENVTPVALQAATVAPVVQNHMASLELETVRALGKQTGKLAGAVNLDLQRLGGDVLALKAEYENALSQKNPLGTPDHAVAETATETMTKPVEHIVKSNDPAVDGEAGTYTQETVDIISAGIGRDAWDEACREKQDLTEAFKGEAGTLFDRAKEVLSYTQKQTTGEDYLSVDESEELIARVIQVEAPASEKTPAVMAVMTHAGFETQIPAYEEKMKLCSQVTGKIITAWSQLDPADCAKVLLFLNKTYVGTELATDSEIVQLQIHLKDADLVAYLKKSKAYLAAQEEGATQADSLRNARLAFAGWVLGHPVASFKELTSAEVQTLFTKFQSMKEKV